MQHPAQTHIPCIPALNDGTQGKRELRVNDRNSDRLIMYETVEGIVGFARTGSHDNLFRLLLGNPPG